MLDLSKQFSVFLYLGKVDMRKSINGLSIIVETVMKQSPLSGSLFVFCNKRRITLKILYWDKNGFCLWLKRLETEKFPWPKNMDEVKEITAEELSWLLKGLDFRKAHKAVTYSKVF